MILDCLSFMAKSKDNSAPQAQLQHFNFTEYGITIQAESMEEAQEQLKIRLSNKKKT